MRKYIVLIFSLVFVLLLAACGNDDAKEDKGLEIESEQTKVEIGEDEKVAEDAIVAEINGVEIMGSAYNLIYAQTKIEFHQHEQDLEDLDKIKQAALDQLVAQQLVIQDANKRGITVTEEEAETEFKQINEETGEQFTLFLEEYDLTEESFKKLLHFSLIHEQYLSIPEMEVSDQEAEGKFDELKAENEEIPEFDLIKDQIKMGIKQDKLDEVVEGLKEKAEIEL